MRTCITLFFLLFSSYCFAQGTSVTYLVGDKEFEGYRTALLEGRPLVILIHDWDGLTDYEIQRANMLDALGYAVFVGDLFGKGVRPTETTEKRALTQSLYADRALMRQRLTGVLTAARQEGGNVDNAVIAGYCFGGAAVLELARSGVPLKGFVSFHGGLSTPDNQDYSDVQGEILVFHGTADKAVAMEEFADLAEHLEAQGIRHEMTTYSGAPHAFTVFGSDRYRKDADQKSWQRFTAYLQATLK
ncbi:dienelactone hydrolase family protein [Desulfogranum japonicum]|uniref:dienelactone hydrolase family protein n=1 Tax=Desulfogranum japonicum TaxID=231447 RepID=UPI00041ABC03|nr:dienelactone hydrolase family protein [Desulfogranum japonicum]